MSSRVPAMDLSRPPRWRARRWRSLACRPRARRGVDGAGVPVVPSRAQGARRRPESLPLQEWLRVAWGSTAQASRSRSARRRPWRQFARASRCRSGSPGRATCSARFSSTWTTGSSSSPQASSPRAWRSARTTVASAPPSPRWRTRAPATRGTRPSRRACLSGSITCFATSGARSSACRWTPRPSRPCRASCPTRTPCPAASCAPRPSRSSPSASCLPTSACTSPGTTPPRTTSSSSST